MRALRTGSTWETAPMAASSSWASHGTGAIRGVRSDFARPANSFPRSPTLHSMKTPLRVAVQWKRWNVKNHLSIKLWPVTHWPCSRGCSGTVNWMFMGLSLVLPTKGSNPWISTKRLGGKRGSVELLVKRGTTTELVVALWPRPAGMIGALSGRGSSQNHSREIQEYL